jgi:sugar phosphate isomerase/epimerase
MIPVWLTDTVTSDLDRALRYTFLWGLEGLVLRTMGSAEERVPHVNEEKLRRRMREENVPVVAIEPGLFEGPFGKPATWLNEIAESREAFAFCNRIGCERVVISSFAAGDHLPDTSGIAEAIRRAGETAADFDCRLLVRNARGTNCVTGHDLAELLLTVDHPAVRAAWNPMEAKRGGEQPGVGLEALEHRVGMVISPDTAVEGDLASSIDLEEQLSVLTGRGFGGPVCLEILTEPKPKIGLSAGTRLVRMMRAFSSS